MEYYINLMLRLGAIHWPFIAVSATIYTITHFFKQVAPPATTNKYWSLVWRLLPIHSVILGFIVGLIPQMPIANEVKIFGGLTHLLYFTGAGVLACWYHDIWITFAKYKLHVVEETTPE